MGVPVFHCYRWHGEYGELRAETARRDRRTSLPPLTVRGWTCKPDHLCKATYTGLDGALRWLWDQMTYVDRYVHDNYPWFVLSLEEDFRTARARLDTPELACDWNTRLPDGTYIVAAVVAVYEPSFTPRTS